MAPELARDQTLENLEKFSERLDRAHDRLVELGRCTCKGERHVDLKPRRKK